MWNTVRKFLGTTALSNPPTERKEPPMTQIVDAMPGEKPVNVLDDHPVRAQKEYICAACKQPILETQLHRRICWKDPNERHPKTGRKGRMHMDRVHMRCW